MSALLLGTSAFTGALVLTSYAFVLANVAGGFTLSLPPTTGYLDSHYWLGLPRDSVIGIIVLQVLAGVGFVAWVIWLASKDDYVIENSILSTLWNRIVLIQVFLLASTAWPFAAYFYMMQRNLSRAIIACVPLWVAALATILLIGGTFEARAPVVPTVSILLFGTVTVLADGVGWSAVCIKSTLQ